MKTLLSLLLLSLSLSAQVPSFKSFNTNHFTTNGYIISLVNTNGGTTINPTDGYLPYRSNATTFGDSPFYYLGTNAVGFNYPLQSDHFIYHPNRFMTAFGEGAGGNTTTAFGAAFGLRALQSVTTGVRNVAVGDTALQLTTVGSDNVGLGVNALNQSVTNYYNTAVGSLSLASAKGDRNTALGYNSGVAITGYKTNTVSIGHSVSATNDNEIVIGNSSNSKLIVPISSWTGAGTLFLSDDGTYKSAGATTINPTDNRIPYRSSSTTFGDSPWHYISGNTNALGYNNTNYFIYSDPTQFTVGIGSRALFSHTTGDDNTVVGVGAATNLTSSGGNVIIGTRSSEELIGGGSNTIIGAHTLQGGTNVFDNTAVGYQSLLGGNENTTVGSYASYNTTGDDNTAIGFAAHRDLTSGSRNIALGVYSARRLLTGNDNLMIGYHAGTNVTTAADTIFIGRHTYGGSTDLTNAIVIGNYAAATASNTAQIGTNGISVLYLNGTVGWYRGSGTPEGAVTANVGSFFSREDGSTDTAMYRKESGTGNTGWVAISGGAGITINPTDEFLPMRTNSTTFVDSSIRQSSQLVTINTPTTQSSGNLLAVANNGTNIFAAGFRGVSVFGFSTQTPDLFNAYLGGTEVLELTKNVELDLYGQSNGRGQFAVSVPGNTTSFSTLNGFLATDATGASGGTTVRYSPPLTLSGSAWDTDDGVSRALTAVIGVKPESGNTTTATISVNSGIAGATTEVGYISPKGYYVAPLGQAYLAANATSTSTTEANLSISATVQSGKKYAFKCIIYCADSVAADGAKFDFAGGSATMTNFRAHSKLTDTALLTSTQTTALGTDVTAATVTGDAELEVNGSMEPSADGTFIPRFAQNAHTTGTITVYRGSHLIVWEIP